MWPLVESEGRDILLHALAAAFLLYPALWQAGRHRDLRRLSYTEKRVGHRLGFERAKFKT